MVKPTTVPSDEHGKDPVVKAKEDLKSKDESVIVVTSGPPSRVKRSTTKYRVLALLGIAFVLLLVLVVLFANCNSTGLFGKDHDEEDSGEIDELSDAKSRLKEWWNERGRYGEGEDRGGDHGDHRDGDRGDHRDGDHGDDDEHRDGDHGRFGGRGGYGHD